MMKSLNFKIDRSISYLAIFVFAFSMSIVNHVFAQDTTVVQTFTFDDITKRRGWYQFPDKSNSYSKILMYYTLKCDPQTKQDKYNCGEWDYETHNYIYDHNATYDSTFQSEKWFTVGLSGKPDKIIISSNKTYDHFLKYIYTIKHDSLYSFDSAAIANGSSNSDLIFDVNKTSNHIQYIWDTSELKNSGLRKSEITGIRFYVENIGSDIYNLEIKMGHAQSDSFEHLVAINKFKTVYNNDLSFKNAGWQSIQFFKAFNWNGVDPIILDINFNRSNGTNTTLKAEQLNKNVGIRALQEGLQSMKFNGSGDRILCGNIPELYGSNSKTVECWAKVDAFDAGGLFSVGSRSGSADFSFRTMSTFETFRMQLWGADLDVVLPGSQNTWHHYAITYNGSKAIIYYDGKKVGEKSASLNTGSGQIEIGNWNGKYFKGQIDEVRIWNTAIDQATLNEWISKPIDNTHVNYNNLMAYYNFEEGNGTIVNNIAPKATNQGNILGNANWVDISSNDYYFNTELLNYRPNIIFEQGNYYSKIDSNLVIDSVGNDAIRLSFRDNPAYNKIVTDEYSKHPSKITSIEEVYYAGYYDYLLDPVTNDIVDSIFINETKTYTNKDLKWYSPTVTYEIGRFITPYGINLDLGNEGFMWIYDVTDYAGLLHDSVDISAGNQQELIDLKFIMIEGTPARDVVNINHLWNQGRSSYQYKLLSDDSRCAPMKVGLNKNAESWKVKTRLSGHGHNSNDGSFPHCCEWKDNTHYLFLENSEVDNWHIWREDCMWNPVYPQGGTWNGSREGWCPGDVVPDHETDITQYAVGKDSIVIDYRITPVPTNNLGMGNGNYLFAMHLIEYGKANFDLDAEVYNVLRPTDLGIYSRQNPICYEPTIVIRNAGSQSLTSLEIEYGVSENNMKVYQWSGNLGFMETEEVALPISDENFWKTDKAVFIVRLKSPNGSTDENTSNDTYYSKFNIPDTYEEGFMIYLRTNSFPDENAYEIRDIRGDLVAYRKNMEANKLYKDTIDLPKGCYTFEFFDEGYGLSYWAWPEQGNGSLSFRSFKGPSLKTFDPDFGAGIKYSFTIGWPLKVQEPNVANDIEVYPNPTNEKFTLELNGIEGITNLNVIDLTGKVVISESIDASKNPYPEFNVSTLPKGIYLIKITNSGENYLRKIVVE